MLRVDPAVHARLRAGAREASLSLNEYCVRRLVADSFGISSEAGPAGATSRARRMFENHLVAVAAYGSWARGDATPASDVDLLVVVEPTVRISRELYRRWDEERVTWEGRAVDPHFAQLPDPNERVAGLWAEVALDGIVLFDATLRLSALLVRVRHDIMEGRIVRRTSHGQPYWVFGDVA